MEKLNEIVYSLNTFDLFYEMSDWDFVYEKGNTERKRIENELSKLTKKEIKQVKENLFNVGKIAWKRYFNKY